MTSRNQPVGVGNGVLGQGHPGEPGPFACAGHVGKRPGLQHVRGRTIIEWIVEDKIASSLPKALNPVGRFVPHYRPGAFAGSIR